MTNDMACVWFSELLLTVQYFLPWGIAAHRTFQLATLRGSRRLARMRGRRMIILRILRVLRAACKQNFYVYGSVRRWSILIIVQRDATQSSLYYSASSLYIFRVSTTPIIRSTQICNYSLRYWLYFLCRKYRVVKYHILHLIRCPN